jgi:NAD+ synthase
MSTRAPQVAEWLRRQVTAAGARGLAFELTGGVDSAAAARLCQRAAPANVLGVILPCHTRPEDQRDALLVAEHFAIPAIRIDLTSAYDRLLADIETAVAGLPPGQLPAARPEDASRLVAGAHMKARIRMSALRFVASSLGYLVAGTLNRSDLTVGRFTTFGDAGVDLLPLGRLIESEVRVLAHALEVPDSIMEKPAGRRLEQHPHDGDDMGFTYDDLENYLTRGPDFVSPALAMRIERRVRSSLDERTLPPMPDAD